MIDPAQYRVVVPLLKYMKFSQALEFMRRVRVQSNLQEKWFDNEARCGRAIGLLHDEGALIMLDCLDREF